MTPVEVLAAHLPEHGECMVGNWRCICGKEGWGDGDADKTRQFAAHVLDALTKAGVAVVELPTPDDESEDDGCTWITDMGTVHAWPDGDITVRLNRIYTRHSGDAPMLGAAVLAAAAEAGGKA